MNRKSFFVIALAILPLVIFLACRKIAHDLTPGQTTIQQAKQFYNDNNAKNDSTASKENLKPEWETAFETKLADGSKSVIALTGKVKFNDSSKLSLLRFYVFKEQGGEIITARIIEVFGAKDFIPQNRDLLISAFGQQKIPDFTGAIIIYDINHKYVISKVFKSGQLIDGSAKVANLKSSSNSGGIVANSIKSQKRIASSRGVTNESGSCSATLTYWLVYYNWDGSEEWQFLFSVCIPNSGSSGNGSENETVTITPDSSITNNQRLKCLYAKLFADTSRYGLSKLTAAFQGETGYNLQFVLNDTLSTDGKTHPLGNGSYQIWLNRNNALDPDYSAIYLASTFIHEGFHAMLAQKAIAVFGSMDVASWPKPINDMTLQELAEYVENHAKDLGVWNGAMHDYMATHIDQMQEAMTSFIHSNYPTTFSSVGSTDIRDLCLMGLEGTTFFKSQYSSSSNSTFQTNIAKFVGVNNCN